MNRICWLCMPVIQRRIRAAVSGFGNRRSRRVPEGAGCSLFWVFLFNPITVSVCADWASTSQVMCLLWKVGQHSYRRWKCDAAKAVAVRFIRWDKGKMNYTVSRISSRSVLNKKKKKKGGRFMLTCNNSSGLPRDRVQHFSCDLGGLQSVSPLPSAGARQTNHVLSWIAFRTSSSLSEKKCMLRDKLSMEPSRLHGCNDNKGIKPVNKGRHGSATWGPVVWNQRQFQFLRVFLCK